MQTKMTSFNKKTTTQAISKAAHTKPEIQTQNIPTTSSKQFLKVGYNNNNFIKKKKKIQFYMTILLTENVNL
jgi:hypothetical protein